MGADPDACVMFHLTGKGWTGKEWDQNEPSTHPTHPVVRGNTVEGTADQEIRMRVLE